MRILLRASNPRTKQARVSPQSEDSQVYGNAGSGKAGQAASTLRILRLAEMNEKGKKLP